MDFSLSQERRMLSETAERYITDTYTIANRHAHAASDIGFDREAWRGFADLGLIGALVTPQAGGLGGTGEDIAVVFQALGKGLVVEPFLATGVLGAGPLMLTVTDAHRALLDDVVAGNHLLALAHGEPQSRYDLANVQTTARSDGDGWVLNGQKAVVLNGDSADTLVVTARTDPKADGEDGLHEEDGLSLFLVAGDAVGVVRRGYGTVDGGRAAEITLSNVKVGSAALIGERGAAYAVVEQTHARAIVAVCAEAVAIMDTAHAITLEYLKTRTQFGRPIASFQVLQHRMVDMALEIEQARSLAMLAASEVDNVDRAVRERAVSAAKNLIGRVGRLVAEETIQLHGGIAMTWEYILPHYAKRLTMIDHQFGDTDYHLARFGRLSEAA